MATIPSLTFGKLLNLETITRPEFLMGQMRAFNVIYLVLFYVLWIYFILPRMLLDPTVRAIAGTVLLALPGYQKIAVMVHPDNLLVLMTTILFVLWLRAEAISMRTWPGVIIYAVAVGVASLTRPFAIVPTAIFGFLGLCLILRRGLRDKRPVRRIVWQIVVFCAIVGVMASTWWVIRYAKSSEVTDTVTEAYIQRYRGHREGFDYVHYIGSFYFFQLLQLPNRRYRTLINEPNLWQNPLSNSFWTLAYSEFWGDHWLYFSGPKMIEEKLWPKRVLFVYALPITLLLMISFCWSACSELARLWNKDWRITSFLIAMLLTLSGFGLFTCWHMTSVLEPGKHSYTKFLYNAYYVSFAIPVSTVNIPKFRKARKLGLAASLILFGLALPVSIYWP